MRTSSPVFEPSSESGLSLARSVLPLGSPRPNALRCNSAPARTLLAEVLQLQARVRKYGSAGQPLVPQLVTVHHLHHTRALTEGGDITDRFKNIFVRRVRAQEEFNNFRVGFEHLVLLRIDRHGICSALTRLPQSRGTA